MTCLNTQRYLSEYLGDELGAVARSEFDAHLATCEACRSEVAGLQEVSSGLEGWREEALPEWGAARMAALRALPRTEGWQGERAAREVLPASRSGSHWGWWQWLPTAASFAMLVLMAFNTQFTLEDSGFSVAFGSANSAPDAALPEAQLEELVARFEQRQDRNNIALMQAVLTQTREAGEASFQQLFSHFEQQRQQDLQEVSSSYEQLVSRDYETVRSLQQLANLVSYDEVR